MAQGHKRMTANVTGCSSIPAIFRFSFTRSGHETKHSVKLKKYGWYKFWKKETI